MNPSHHNSNLEHDHKHNPQPTQKGSLGELAPVLVALTLTAVLALAITYLMQGNLSIFMRFYMGIFFILFSTLKLVNIKGFVNAFKTYDILAKRFEPYAFSYPFIELGLGIMFILDFRPLTAATITLVVMSLGIVGVTKALKSKSRIQCACMGTLFNLPMTKVTFTENSLMILMSVLMLSGALPQ